MARMPAIELSPASAGLFFGGDQTRTGRDRGRQVEICPVPVQRRGYSALSPRSSRPSRGASKGGNRPHSHSSCRALRLCTLAESRTGPPGVDSCRRHFNPNCQTDDLEFTHWFRACRPDTRCKVQRERALGAETANPHSNGESAQLVAHRAGDSRRSLTTDKDSTRGSGRRPRVRDRCRVLWDVVSGADPIGERPGFKATLDRIAGNGVRVIIVESPDRFARDPAVQLAGHNYLRSLGVELVPASAPDFFLEDTPTAVRAPAFRRHQGRAVDFLGHSISCGKSPDM